MTEGHGPDPAAIQAQHKQVKESLARVVHQVAGSEPVSGGLDALVRTYWPLLAALVAFAVGWGALTVQSGSNEKAIVKLEDKIDKQSDMLITIQNSIAGMQAASLRDSAMVAELQLRLRAVENVARPRRD